MDYNKIYLERANEYYLKNDYTSALSAYDQAIYADPLNDEVYYLRALTLIKLARLEESLEYFDKALKLNIRYEKAYYEKGKVLLSLEKNSLAKETYTKLLEINPDSEEAKAMLAYNSGNYIEAIKYFDKVLTKNFQDIDAHYYKGSALYSLGDYEMASRHFDEALKIKPDFSAAIYGYGLVSYKLRDYALAYKYFSRSVNFADSKYYKAKIDYDFKEYEKVINSLYYCNNKAKLYNIKGLAYHMLGDYFNSAAALEQAISLEPNFVESYINYGNLLVDLGQLGKALSYYDKAIGINPNIAQPYYKKSEVLSALWQKHAAIENLHKAIKLNSEYSILYLCKQSQEYSLLGEEAKAKESIDKAFELVKAGGLSLEFTDTEINYINHALELYANSKGEEQGEKILLQFFKNALGPIECSVKEIAGFLKSLFKKKDVIEVSEEQLSIINEYLSMINIDERVTIASLLGITEATREAFMKYYQDSIVTEICELDKITLLHFVNVQPDSCLAGALYQLSGD